MSRAYLVLANGQRFEGEAIGARAESIGELVFTTGMVGYLETLSDPSYAGQIIMQTFPLIGNYGVITPDLEGRPACRGYVCREICAAPSNFRSEYELDRFLKENRIPGITGVDTRAITRLIREEGVMNAAIVYDLPADMAAIRSYSVRNAVASVSTGTVEYHAPEGKVRFRVALMDYGAKKNIIRCLLKRGCHVTVYPYNTPAEVVLASRPDGIMLSNGPGDPAENLGPIREIRKMLGQAPIFGICLGHQLTALAAGGKTYKLKYGHRGGNQPVTDLLEGRTYITSQNHGYAVDAAALPYGALLRYVNANDMSSEGIDYPALRCFTVQFHPEAASGPHDTEFLFDRFMDMMGGESLAQR